MGKHAINNLLYKSDESPFTKFLSSILRLNKITLKDRCKNPNNQNNFARKYYILSHGDQFGLKALNIIHFFIFLESILTGRKPRAIL